MPGTGAAFGYKASDSYGAMIILVDGEFDYKYVNIYYGEVHTNLVIN